MIKKALIVIDLQNDYFEGGSMELEGVNEVLKQSNKLIKYAREQNYKIYFVQHFALAKEATFFVPETDGVELHYKLDVQEDTIVKKHYPNSFRETILKEELDKENIHDLIICGAMTHMCIDTTVRAGFDLGYNIVLANDACATKNLEFKDRTIDANEVQLSFISALGSIFCEVKQTDNIINL